MSNAELIEALDRLDALFSDESKWTQGEFARDVKQEHVRSLAPAAVCWCILGGLSRAEAGYVILELQATIGHNMLAYWNDAPERTFADVKKLIADTRARLAAQ